MVRNSGDNMDKFQLEKNEGLGWGCWTAIVSSLILAVGGVLGRFGVMPDHGPIFILWLVLCVPAAIGLFMLSIASFPYWCVFIGICVQSIGFAPGLHRIASIVLILAWAVWSLVLAGNYLKANKVT